MLREAIHRIVDVCEEVTIVSKSRGIVPNHAMLQLLASDCLMRRISVSLFLRSRLAAVSLCQISKDIVWFRPRSKPRPWAIHVQMIEILGCKPASRTQFIHMRSVRKYNPASGTTSNIFLTSDSANARNMCFHMLILALVCSGPKHSQPS